ncbi:MAG: hypothetical protein ACYDBQ_10260, partial [Thermoplasmatota archaeon]
MNERRLPIATLGVLIVSYLAVPLAIGQTTTSCNPKDTPTVMSNGVQETARTPPSAALCYLAIEVPAGQLALKVVETNPTGVEREFHVGTAPYDASLGNDVCHKVGGSEPESCDIASPAAQRWWVAVGNYQGNGQSTSTDGFTLTATFTAGTNCGTASAPVVLTSRIQLSGATPGQASCYLAIDVPAGQLALKVVETNPTGVEREFHVGTAPYDASLGNDV